MFTYLFYCAIHAPHWLKIVQTGHSFLSEGMCLNQEMVCISYSLNQANLNLITSTFSSLLCSLSSLLELWKHSWFVIALVLFSAPK